MSWRSHRFSRRRVIGAVGALGTLGLLAACAQSVAPTAAPPKPTEPPKPAEAPKPTAAAEAAKPTAAPRPEGTRPAAEPTKPAAEATKPAAEATKPAPSPTVAAAAPAKPAETVEIRFGIHDDPAARKPIVERFAKQYPNIKVTVEQIADFPVKIPTMAAAGTLPDVVRMWEAMILDMARAGQIISLDDRIKAQADFNPDDFVKVFWDYPVVNGKRYGVADVMAPHFTLYNVDLLEKAGVPMPKADDTWTWDAYVAAAQKITRPADKIWGSDTIPIGWQYWTAKMMWQNGGDFFSPDYGECVIDKPEAIETVDYWAALLLKGDLMPTPEQAQATKDGQGGGFFQSGNVGLGRWGVWLARPLLQAKFRWNLVPEPKRKQRATILHTAFNGMTKSSKQQDAAWLWLNAYVSTDGTYDYAHFAAFPSVRKSANQRKPWVLEGGPPEINWDLIPEAGNYGRVLPGPRNEQQALKMIGDGLQEIYLGKRKAAEVLKEVAPRVTSLIRAS